MNGGHRRKSEKESHLLTRVRELFPKEREDQVRTGVRTTVEGMKGCEGTGQETKSRSPS